MAQTILTDAVGHSLKTNATVYGYQYLPNADNQGGNVKVFAAGSNVGNLVSSYDSDGVDFIETEINYTSYFIPFGEWLFTLYDGSNLTAYGTVSDSGIKPGPDPAQGGGSGGNNTDNGSGSGGGNGDGGSGSGSGSGSGGSGSGGGGLLGLGNFNLFGLSIPWALVIGGLFIIYEVGKSNNNGKR